MTDNEDGTATIKLYKADGTTQWGNDLIVTTAPSADTDAVTGVNDTAS